MPSESARYGIDPQFFETLDERATARMYTIVPIYKPQAQMVVPVLRS